MNDTNQKPCPQTKLFRCGWCGFPTDEKGNPIHKKNTTQYISEMLAAGAKEHLVNGTCCQEQNETMNPPTREMLMDAGLA